jgi:hypothetical protein
MSKKSVFHYGCHADFLFFAAEVVLSLLIETFEFSPSEKEISWEMAAIVSPMVVGGETRPQLPVMVKLVQPID